MVESANAVVVIIGLLILSASVWGIVATPQLLRLVASVMETSAGMLMAIGVRVVLGLSLIVAAPASRAPTVFFFIGGLSLFAAAALPFIGRTNVQKLIRWLGRWPLAMIRGWLVLAILFATYLVYAIVR